MVMNIKGLFRRYERWNPVHPTYGAFWGMGVGVGCGVGWGPGFGPEVIGYVGAGCGVGFSVGITLAGIGIGLPANIITDGPYKALIATTSYTRDLTRSSNIFSVRNNADDELKSNANESFSFLKNLDTFIKGTKIFDVKNALSTQQDSIPGSFESLKRNSESDRDNKDGSL